MDSDEEIEEFRISQFDLDNAMQPGRKRKFTKEQAMLGMWADDDDTDNFRPSFGESRQSGADYTDALGFVSAGFVQKGKKSNDSDENVREGTDDDSEPQAESTSKKSSKQSSASRYESKERRYHISKGKGDRGKGKGSAGDFGKWEKYTKGFGTKMLEKMGYKVGQGLGKGGEGITEPVQAYKRSGRGAIGAYGPERPKGSEMAYDSEEEEEKKIRQEIKKLGQWKKSGQEKNKPKYIYKTADDVKASGKPEKKTANLLAYSKVKIVDMTGPETKVLSGYGSLSHQHAKPDQTENHPVLSSKEEIEQAFSLRELEYNLDLLVDLAETEIVQTDRQLKYERDLVVNLTYEREKLERVCDEEADEIRRLEHVLHVIDRAKKGLNYDEDKPLTLEGLLELFKMLQDKYYEEYKMYDLDSLVIPLGFPLLANHFETWLPLNCQHYGLDVVRLWKDMLEERNAMTYNKEQNRSQSMGPFEKLIWDVLMPHIRRAVSEWSPRQPVPLIELIEAWSSVFPTWVTENIMDQLVMPRLQVEVDAWNPLMDPVPIHSWMHPWLPLMGQRLEPLYAPIRHKLVNALTNWHPSDPSAKLILEPWAKVFSKGAMDAFLIRSIYPRLTQCMADFVINPHQQHLEPFQWVMEWKDLLSHQHLASILDKHFFPKWLQILRQWLTSDPNYNEVTKWYLGWKSMFSDDLLSNPAIKEHFNRALSIMNQAVSGTLQPGARENVAYLTSTERRREAEAKAIASEKAAYSTNVPSNFKELVEKAAEDNDLIFIPMPNRNHEGRTVYSFGKCTISLDRNVIFVNSQGLWKPIALSELVDIA